MYKVIIGYLIVNFWGASLCDLFPCKMKPMLEESFA